MLKVCRKYKELDFEQLTAVCRESIENSMEQDGLSRFQAEQDFLDYLKEDFFSQEGAFYALWVRGNACVSALRMEPYLDGFLLTGFETAPERRREGHAKCLLCAVVQYAQEWKAIPIYSHVHKRNTASFNLHFGIGFKKVLDYGKLIDGTLSQDYCTMRYE